MIDRVLFVDDDQMLLSSLERCLGDRFDLDTALSGPEALRMLGENAEYGVVVTDMRMPIMDGVEFLRRAREIAPHVVYLMLTGNQDVATATRAVNEGGVYQMLNKPCDPDEIALAVDQALRRYDLDRSERELFQGTVEGAIAIVGDVISIRRPDLTSKVQRSERILERLRIDLGLEARHDFLLAARLAPLGFALSPIEPSDRAATPAAGSPEHHQRTAFAFACSAQIVGHLPQLAEVAEIIRRASTSDGAFTETGGEEGDDRVRQGAALLRAAYLMADLLEEGVEPDTAGERLALALPGASGSFLQAITEAYPDGCMADGVSLDIDALRPDMVLSRELRGPDGKTLMSAGRRLSEAHIAKLRGKHGAAPFEGRVEVTRQSYESLAAVSGEPAALSAGESS